MRRAALAALLLAPTGCATGLFQTARTLPAGDLQAGLGVTRVFTDREAAAEPVTGPGAARPSTLEGFTLPEAGLRIGLGRQTDLGVASYLGPGLRLDAKHNLMPDRKPYALAPRVGGGWAQPGGGSLWVWLVGLVASYDVHRVLSFYTGTSFVVHYIRQKPDPRAPPLAPGERLVGRTAWGDGLLQLALGLELRMSGSTALQAEYGYWAPLQNDPGDGYQFVPAHLLGARLVLGPSAPPSGPR